MRITPDYLGTWVAGQMKKAGITKPGACHLMRHSMATAMHCNGADIRFVQEMLGHARLETTQIYTHVNIQALQEVHARCHPHGKLPSDSSADGSDGSNKLVNDPERPPVPPASGYLIELSSCPKPDDGLSTVPAMTTVMPHPATSPEPPISGSPPPGDDDPPAGIGTRRRPNRPRTPGPRKYGNTLAINRLDSNCADEETMHVACYGYRYYDPLTGRWPSRDPAGIIGGYNIVAVENNDFLNKFDFLGLRCKISFDCKLNSEKRLSYFSKQCIYDCDETRRDDEHGLFGMVRCSDLSDEKMKIQIPTQVLCNCDAAFSTVRWVEDADLKIDCSAKLCIERCKAAKKLAMAGSEPDGKVPLIKSPPDLAKVALIEAAFMACVDVCQSICRQP
jgi:RHS repeat-associated protein